MNSGSHFSIQNQQQLQNGQNPLYQVFLQPVQSMGSFPVLPAMSSLEQLKRTTSIQSMTSDYQQPNTMNIVNLSQNYLSNSNNYINQNSEQTISQFPKQQYESLGVINQTQNINNVGGFMPNTQSIQQIKDHLQQLLYMQQAIEQQISYYKQLIQQSNLQIDPLRIVNQISGQSPQINNNKNLLSQSSQIQYQNSNINNNNNNNNTLNQNDTTTMQRQDLQVEINDKIQTASSGSIQEKLLKRQKVAEELSDCMQFLIDNMGVLSTDKIFEKKKELKYLTEREQIIFDQIVNKYQYSKKTKEEMIKFILRKCFKFLKSDMKQYDLTQQKEMDKAFFDKYFDSLDFTCDDQFMPFKKKSSLKTMNSQFLKKIFKSQLFSQGYHQYLERFEEISIKENKKKVNKFVNYILELIDKNKLEKMKGFKRLPWLNSWLKDTHEIAKSLILYEEQSFQQRSSSSQEKSDSGTKKKLRSEESNYNLICPTKKQEIIKIEMDENIQNNFQYNQDKNFKSPISQPISNLISTYNQINPLNLSSLGISSRQGLSDDNSFQDLH